MTPGDDDVPSPCVSICRMGAIDGASDCEADTVCLGCLRTLDEIIEWGSATPTRKRQIVADVDRRRAR